jgi:GT2 family glycosyltransferase
MDRSDLLERCLDSILAGDTLPAEVVVSDDSRRPEKTIELCGRFPVVRYVPGPQRGLCANRNNAVVSCTSDYIGLLDDDAAVMPDFVGTAIRLIQTAPHRTVFTGDILESEEARRLGPVNPTFLGHFGKTPRGEYQTVHLNCNLFPRGAFVTARFDESIVYGYEDMDLCQQLLSAGYRIEYRPQLLNRHLPPPKSVAARAAQERQSERERYYTSLRRYWTWQRKPLAAMTYAAVAPLHQAAHCLLRRQTGRMATGFADMWGAVGRVMQSQ